MWNLQDKKDYVQYLSKEIREENKKPVSIAKMVNINNLQADLNSMNVDNNFKK